MIELGNSDNCDSDSQNSSGWFGSSIIRLARSRDLPTLALGFLLAFGVCAPFLGGSPVYLLDWTIGPHAAEVSPTVLGLSGGLTTGVGTSIVISWLGGWLGSAVTWLPIFIFFPIATVGAGRLAGRGIAARLAAGTFYAVNPFVFNRIFVGHFPLLIGYALLPYAILSAVKSLHSSPVRWLAPALWWAILTALSPHFAWIFGLVLVCVFLVESISRVQSMPRVVCWFLMVTAAFAILNLYILFPTNGTSLQTTVGKTSLDLYRTIGDPHLGLFINVLGLYGFWRVGPGPILPKEVISGWPLFLVALIAISVFGFVYALRRGDSHRNVARSGDETKQDLEVRRNRIESLSERKIDEGSKRISRQIAFLLIVLGSAGFFLALGDEGPTGPLFLWAYNHVPFFAVMREPQKFLMLLALAYATSFGWGIERLVVESASRGRTRTVVLAVVLGIGLPLAYTPTIFAGLNGQVTASSLPVAYQQANRVMGQGVGNILYLPWHLYMAYPFTHGRVVVNVGGSSFSRNVISGDNVQSSGVGTQSTSLRSAYLTKLFADGTSLKQFGALVAPLGVEYVVLAKSVDWRSYDWINSQADLRLIYNSSSLKVWKNLAYLGVGEYSPRLTKVKNLEDVLSLAKNNELEGQVVVLRAGSRDSLDLNRKVTKRASSECRFARCSRIRELSPVAYSIAPGKSGWVSVDAPYEQGWSIGGQQAKASAAGTLIIQVGTKGGKLQFAPWSRVRLGYLVSLTAFFSFIFVLLIGWRREKLRKYRARK
jgi:hypothetical protein